VIVHGLDDAERKQAYACDITYGTTRIRLRLSARQHEVPARDRSSAALLRHRDEVDSILIDEARTPLIISGPLDDRSEFYNTIDTFFPQLDKTDYDVDESSAR